MENIQSKIKSTLVRILSILYQIVFWAFSIVALIIAIIFLLNKFYCATAFCAIGAIGINPLFHKIKLNKSKLFHHLRRSISFILIITSFIIAFKTRYPLSIRNNSLATSHKQIINVLNKYLTKELGEKINTFNEVEINDKGKSNGYKIYSTTVDENLNIQLIEKNSKIEAIRICKVDENGIDKFQKAGSIMSYIISNCKDTLEGSDSIIEELKYESLSTGEITKDKYILKSTHNKYYSELVIIYNTYEVKTIKEINSKEILDKIESITLKERASKIDEIIKDSENKVNNESTSIENLESCKKSLKEISDEIDSLKDSTVEEIAKNRELWKNTIKELLPKIEERLTVVVPDFNTMSSTDAKNWGDANKISVKISHEYSSSISNNKLISQSINAGKKAQKGYNTINLVYSLGRKPTLGEQNALEQAKSYSKHLHMSKRGIYEQLTSSFEGFTASEAQYAIDHLED